MWERLRRFKALDSPTRGLFVRSVVVLELTQLSLRLRGFRATEISLRKLLGTSEKDSAGPAFSPDAVPAKIAVTDRMVQAAIRYGFGHPTCLEKSLTLWWLLARQGISCNLRIGARKTNKKVEAHAWVEYEGVPLSDPEELHRHYAVFEHEFFSLPPEIR
jgi:hypothetical protein